MAVDVEVEMASGVAIRSDEVDCSGQLHLNRLVLRHVTVEQQFHQPLTDHFSVHLQSSQQMIHGHQSPELCTHIPQICKKTLLRSNYFNLKKRTFTFYRYGMV